MTLVTRWGSHLAGSESPLPEYPRPQLQRRRWASLNGTWRYAVRDRGAELPRDEQIPSEFDGNITVPFAVETAASGVGRPFTPDEVLFYQRDIEVPWSGRTALNFEAVDYACAVFVDGVLAAEHRGGYLPFTVDLAEGEGPRRVIVVVHDPSDSGNQQHGKQALKPGGIWYTATSGIWGTVWMEPLPENAVTRVVATTPRSRDGLLVLVEAERAADVAVAVRLPDGGVAEASGRTGEELRVPLPDARLWSPSDPYLYRMTVRVGDDEVESWAGVRTVDLGPIPGVTTERPAVLLNGEPILLNTPLDQGYWPESGLTPPADEAMEYDLATLKRMGFNGARMHIKIASRRYYHLADQLGMLIVQDMVSGGTPRTGMVASAAVQFSDAHLTDRSDRAMKAAGRGEDANRREFLAELAAMVRLLSPHPSVVAWVPFNESWGQFDARGAAALVRRLDPTRLIDHASGWFDQGDGDFRSRHRYTLALKRPPRRDQRPFWLSEFGGYNLAVEGHLWDEKERFGYKFFDDANALATGIAALWRDQLIPLVEHGLRAAVYTQVSDVEIENNGLMTYDRAVIKVPVDLMRDLNAELYAALRALGA